MLALIILLSSEGSVGASVLIVYIPLRGALRYARLLLSAFPNFKNMPQNFYSLQDISVVYTSGQVWGNISYFASGCFSINRGSSALISPHSLNSMWSCCQKWAEVSVIRGLVKAWAGR